jgi:hypothetical protein
MRRIRRHLTFANVASAIALFVALTGGTAVALSGSNTVFTDDITDNNVYSADVRNDTLAGGGLAAFDLRPNAVGSSEVSTGAVGTTEVANGSLNDEDIGQFAVADYQVAIGNVPGNDCTYVAFPAGSAQGDHILLTPDFSTTAFDLDYHVQYSAGEPRIAVCNATNTAINDGNTNFNVLWIDAQ